MTSVNTNVGALVALVVVNNCLSDACQKAIIAIGLAGGAALSAIAQVAAVVGAWLLWTSVRREKNR